MTATSEADKNDKKKASVRQRKAHRKSRLGCSNCKLRSVKCDESKPSCTRCLTSGFICSFTNPSSTTTLHLAHRSAGPIFSVAVADPASDQRLRPPLPGLKVPIAQPTRGAVGEFILGEAELAALERFRVRTVLTVGTARTRHIYKDGAFNLGIKHPFLIHVFLAMSLLHDTHLHPSQPPSHRSSLAFHWYHATALFHQRLLAAHSSPSLSSLVSSERDALWASGALLGGAAFALLDVQDPREAWPLKRPDAMDLDWLKMSDGKKVVWRIADPSREESIFHGLVADRASMPDGRKAVPLGVLPSGFYTVFELMDSTPVTNPYHVAASLLAQLLHREPDENSVVEFLTFLTQLDPRYRRLLEEKDPRAMVLLAWWYAKAAGHCAWWIQRRTVVEGRAICIYLERNCCGHVDGIEELLGFPKRVFGLWDGGLATTSVELNTARVDSQVY